MSRELTTEEAKWLVDHWVRTASGQVLAPPAERFF